MLLSDEQIERALTYWPALWKWQDEDLSVEEIRALRALPYSEYLTTAHWKLVRAAVKERDIGLCCRCYEGGSGIRLHVHHKTYVRIGCERLEDLETLCDDCHRRVHGLKSRWKM